MIQALRNVWSIPDLRRRILFTFAMLGVYRIGAHIPTPGINAQALLDMFNAQKGSILGYVDMFSGGNFSQMTIFALGIMPYITASIILQLLTVVWPYLEKLSKEGEAGRKKITQYTRYLTVGLSTFQGLGVAITLNRQPNLVSDPGPQFILITVLTLAAGALFIMWLGEQITARGVGKDCQGYPAGDPQAVFC